MNGTAAKRLLGRDRSDIWIAVGHRAWWWTVGLLVLAGLSGPGCGSNLVPPTSDDSGIDSIVDAGVDSGVDSGVDAGADAGVECAPYLDQSGQDTGLDSCTNGNLQRRASIQCSWPRTGPVPVCNTSTCASDNDCPGSPPTEPKGYCAQAHNVAGYCGCISGCHEDADCGPGWICECGFSTFGRCIMAQCATNADCGAGFACVATVVSTPARPCIPASSHDPTLFVCQTAADGCRGSTECDDPGQTNMCLYDGARRVCGYCAFQL
jgi:hypothetical protein